MMLTDEELNFIANIVTKESTSDNSPSLKVKPSLPNTLKSILNNATLTLLAELGDYQLWFPLELKVDHLGQFTPILAAPEVIEKQGVERSWRFSQTHIENDEFIIQSLSSTGIVLKPKQRQFTVNTPHSISFTLPHRKLVRLLIQPIRSTPSGIAAKIISIKSGRRSLRKFLFDQHKLQNSSLYAQSEHTFSAF
ncbi:hypothetical protein J8L70_03065 [Pseudoalteromonas sp. MMG010]|uniref:hypothetical protein n=1 Tax=Pseudoalteromonas sp. MMG010 TaxID=2822685 RepID=UPI001B3A77B5|nr:hypothetical protein [Pseudoalteromonas sp. MMG010]MBQ4832211.1 hypothetical protein [Pseudoalteromonas sp. MMG010]